MAMDVLADHVAGGFECRGSACLGGVGAKVEGGDLEGRLDVIKCASVESKLDVRMQEPGPQPVGSSTPRPHRRRTSSTAQRERWDKERGSDRGRVGVTRQPICDPASAPAARWDSSPAELNGWPLRVSGGRPLSERSLPAPCALESCPRSLAPRGRQSALDSASCARQATMRHDMGARARAAAGGAGHLFSTSSFEIAKRLALARVQEHCNMRARANATSSAIHFHAHLESLRALAPCAHKCLPLHNTLACATKTRNTCSEAHRPGCRFVFNGKSYVSKQRLDNI